MITVETMSRMVVEIVSKKKPARADTAEEAKMRKQLIREIAEIHARGLEVEIPVELPDL